MHERIKTLRKYLGLNQTDFGARIGVKQTSVAGYETGARVPLDAVVSSICREFHVNETWLRTGEGEMLEKLDEDQELVEFMTGLLGNSSDSFKKRFVSVLANLDPGDWAALERIADEIANRKTDP